MRVKSLVYAGAVALLAACNAAETPEAATPSNGQVSLQTAPYAGDGALASPEATTPPPETQGASFAAITNEFNPGKQHFVWVLPPGLHGEGPWTLAAVVKHRGETKFETTFPLKAELATPGSRPEYPAGHEIVRLTDDGRWAERTAEIDKVIRDLVAEHGRGDGEVQMTNTLKLSVDDAHRTTYCIENKPADIRLYMEDDSQADLLRLDVNEMSAVIQASVKGACER